MPTNINFDKKLGITGGTSIITPTDNFTNTYSIELDGIDAYVDCGDNNNLSFGDGSTDSAFSISAWIKPDDSEKFRIVFKYNATQSLREYYFQIAGGQQLQVGLYDASNLGSLARNGVTTIPENVWSHVAMTYNGNGSNTDIRIYLNGSPDNGSTAGSGTYTAMNNTSEPLLIGEFDGGTSADGEIDEVAIFNTGLSAVDITNIYNGGVPTDLSEFSSLVSWWRFEEGSGTSVADSGSGSNTGTLQNSATFSTDTP